MDELARIQGFDTDVATELKNRAASFLQAKKAEFDKKCKDLGITAELANMRAAYPRTWSWRSAPRE